MKKFALAAILVASAFLGSQSSTLAGCNLGVQNVTLTPFTTDPNNLHNVSSQFVTKGDHFALQLRKNSGTSDPATAGATFSGFGSVRGDCFNFYFSISPDSLKSATSPYFQITVSPAGGGASYTRYIYLPIAPHINPDPTLRPYVNVLCDRWISYEYFGNEVWDPQGNPSTIGANDRVTAMKVIYTHPAQGNTNSAFIDDVTLRCEK